MKPIRDLITRIRQMPGEFRRKSNSKNAAAFEENRQSRGLLSKTVSRRQAIGALAGGGVATAALANAVTADDKTAEKMYLKWEEYFKGNYRLMTTEEKNATIDRLTKLHEMATGDHIQLSGADSRPGVLFGYAFNISKCKGYMDCVDACVKENNLDRSTGMQYIRIFEQKNGSMDLHSANGRYEHEVPQDGSFYLGTQCFHCENPPCTKVCPVGATWKEPDGIVVVDYDWCIGCRYCEAACPYWGRRFNWTEPQIPPEELNLNQHYLGNRPRQKGVMEKCTFCVQRTRQGRQPACVEACPTGARVFGNLLDPNSEIRWIIENKKVFRMKEELGTEPKFWYYMD